MLILNLKTYSQSTGENVRKLLDDVDRLISEKPELKNIVFVAPAITDLFWAKQNYPNINLIAQHVDNLRSGSTTGWLPFELLKSIGIDYAILNHSEHRVYSDKLLEDVKQLQQHGQKIVVCCESIEEAKQLATAEPYAIAFEQKDLIGSGVSISKEVESLQEFVNVIGNKSITLAGAGVSTGADVSALLDLKVNGAILASAFVKAENPYEKLSELVAPFSKV